jgi:hypothetical protein
MSLRESDPHDRCYCVTLDCGSTLDLDCTPQAEDDYVETDGVRTHLPGACSSCDRTWQELDDTAQEDACYAARCNGELHYSGQRHPDTNEDTETGPCPAWKAAAA